MTKAQVEQLKSTLKESVRGHGRCKEERRRIREERSAAAAKPKGV